MEHFIEVFSNRRLNLIINGTGRMVDASKSTAELLTAKGHIGNLRSALESLKKWQAEKFYEAKLKAVKLVTEK